MTCSVTLNELKDKFHSRIYHFYACADVEVNGQRPWKILSHYPFKLRDVISGSLKMHLPLTFFLRLLKSLRNYQNCVNEIILIQAK